MTAISIYINLNCIFSQPFSVSSHYFKGNLRVWVAAPLDAHRWVWIQFVCGGCVIMNSLHHTRCLLVSSLADMGIKEVDWPHFFQINMGETYCHLFRFFIVSDLFCSIFPEISAQSSAGNIVARAGLSRDRNNAEINVSHLKELKQHGKTHETLKWQHFILFYNIISH